MSESKMFDYIVHGGDKVAELEASLEHIGGALSLEIELNAELRAEIERLRAALKSIADPLMLTVEGTGTAMALRMIGAMRDIAHRALEQKASDENE